MTKRVGVWVVIGMLVVAPAMGFAAEHGGKAMAEHGGKAMAGDHKLWTLSLTSDYTASPWTTETGYANRAGSKLLFGVKNLLLGWTEIFTEPKEALDSGENFFVGLGKGLKNGIEQELGGVVHIVSFPITCLDAPLPEGGTKLM